MLSGQRLILFLVVVGVMVNPTASWTYQSDFSAAVFSSLEDTAAPDNWALVRVPINVGIKVLRTSASTRYARPLKLNWLAIRAEAECARALRAIGRLSSSLMLAVNSPALLGCTPRAPPVLALS
jgi:hypothetical protein